MNNNKGSILTVTLGFVLIFSLLGVALIRHATVQNETTERRTHSVESLWIADAAVELARQKLGEATPDLIEPDEACITDPGHAQYPECGDADSYAEIGGGSYHVFSEEDRCHCYQDKEEAKQCYSGDLLYPECTGPHPLGRWHIRSLALVHKHDVDGSALNSRRGIDAVLASYDVSNAITTHGTVNDSCVPAGSAQIIGNCEAHVDFTFPTVFNGMTYADFQAMASADPAVNLPPPASHLFHLSSPADLFEVDNVTVLFMEDNFNTISINTDDPAVYMGPSLLIVDSTGYTGNPVPKVDVTGNIGFCGIIWVIGHAKFTGTSTIRGAVFIDETPAADTTVTGNPDIIFDPVCAQSAIDSFGGTGDPGLIAWKEYAL